jgi:hypothetical protein
MHDPWAGANAAPCDECPLELLDEYLAGPAGRLIGQTIDLDFALQAGVNVSLRDISYPEFLLLRILTEERNRYHEEEMRKASQRHGR